jgi:hypothetical protein
MCGNGYTSNYTWMNIWKTPETWHDLVFGALQAKNNEKLSCDYSQGS